METSQHSEAFLAREMGAPKEEIPPQQDPSTREPGEEEPGEVLTENQVFIMELRGPCVGCGRVLGCESVTEADRMAAWFKKARSAEASNSLKSMAGSLERLTFWCPVCFKKSAAERDILKRKESARQIRQNAVWGGLLPKTATAMTFQGSERMIEVENHEAWSWGREWTPGSGNAWIFGPVGTGKTFLARSILNRAIDEHFLSVGEITAEQWVETAVKYSDHIEHRAKLREVGLLLIEDIDKASWTEQAFDMFFELVNYRYDAKLRMLITTNAKPEYMLERQTGVWRKVCRGNPSKASAVMDRLRPMTRFEFKGGSHRG